MNCTAALMELGRMKLPAPPGGCTRGTAFRAQPEVPALKSCTLFGAPGNDLSLETNNAELSVTCFKVAGFKTSLRSLQCFQPAKTIFFSFVSCPYAS